MVTETTQGIKISVESIFQSKHSKPSLNKFIHSYWVRIENKSQHTVQLMRRYWHIKDSLGSIKEVEGEGVIGEQPILKPGEHHEYTSWCILHSEFGKMNGEFSMERLIDYKQFQVKIPEFRLAADFALN